MFFPAQPVYGFVPFRERIITPFTHSTGNWLFAVQPPAPAPGGSFLLQISGQRQQLWPRANIPATVTLTDANNNTITVTATLTVNGGNSAGALYQSQTLSIQRPSERRETEPDGHSEQSSCEWRSYRVRGLALPFVAYHSPRADSNHVSQDQAFHLHCICQSDRAARRHLYGAIAVTIGPLRPINVNLSL